jgi:hypothetical protein
VAEAAQEVDRAIPLLSLEAATYLLLAPSAACLSQLRAFIQRPMASPAPVLLSQGLRPAAGVECEICSLPRNIHRNLSRRAERLDSIRRVRQPAQNCRIAWQHFAATRRGNPHDPPLLLRRSTVTLTSLLNYSTLNRFPHYNSFCSCCS